MLVLSRLLLLLFFLITFNVPLILGDESAVRSTVTHDIISRFSITSNSCWLLLPVEIQGKIYQFNLDTGTNFTAYDKSLWQLLGKRIASKKIGPKEENLTVPFFNPPNARLGKLALPKESWVIGVQLNDFHEESGEEVHGILGMDFLKDQIFRVDFDRGEVVFLRAVGPDPGQRLNLRLAKNKPQVKVDLPALNEPEWFLLDTGTARGGGGHGGCLRQATFEALIQSGNITSIHQVPRVGVAKRGMVRIGCLDSFPFAGNTHKALMFSEERISLVGLDILSRYVVTFDFPHLAVYLKKGRQFDRPIRYDRSGLHIRCVKGETVVVSVKHDSTAAKAGIRLGDVLLQIDKEKINGMTLFTLRDRLCEEGKNIHFTLRRGAQVLDVPLILSK